MVVQRITLRPTFSYTASYNLYPSDTGRDQAYILVSEESSDEDSTYVILDDLDTLSDNGFGFTVDSLEMPTKMQLVVRAKGVNLNEPWITAYFLISEGLKATESRVEIGTIYLTDSYVSYTIKVPSDKISEIWGFMKSDTMYNDTIKHPHLVLFGDEVSFSGDSFDKELDHEIRVTQVYLELIYDDGKIESYLKKSGTWEEINGTVYEKINGIWVTGTLDDLQAGNYVAVREI